jgi:hypothetical protein
MKPICNVICILILFFIHGGLCSQQEASKWYFGNNAGLDFSSHPPSALSGNAMMSTEGVACIADKTGNMLFYTDGSTIWNQANSIMANGTGLMGDNSSTQSAVIVQLPGSASLYYVFTTDDIGGPDGLRYSIVDMSLAAGMGSVTTKNAALHAPTTEKLTAIRHCNGKDVWILSHDMGSDNFRAYLLTSSGVNTTPVITAIGSVHSGSLMSTGGMKVSPNGKKIALAIGGNTVAVPNNITAFFELFDFDPASGVLSNSLSLGPYFVTAYQCEFSPDGSKLYGTLPIGEIRQWDLCAGSHTAIIASEYTFTSTATWGMQLAPNGKIYTSRWGYQDLGVFHNPNLPGAAANYTDVGLSLGTGTCLAGLPNFNASFLRDPSPAFSYTVDNAISCLTASFTAPPAMTVTTGCSATISYTSLTWLFGDPGAGPANTSSLLNPFHAFSAPGTYTTKLVYHSDCSADTVMQVITINSPSISITGTPTLCAGKSLTLTASGAGHYTWTGGANSPSIVVSPGLSTSFSVTGASASNDCSSGASITVTVLPSPTLSTSQDFTICSGNSLTLTVSGAPSVLWSHNTATTTSVAVTPVTNTFYTVTGTGTNNCSSSRSISVMVNRCTSLEELAPGKVSIQLYPNPNSSYLMIRSEGPLKVLIVDASGRLVFTGRTDAHDSSIGISHLVPGIYSVYTLDEQQRTETLRFIKHE